MGTSVSQRSPNTPGWRVVSACYTSDTVPVDRAVVEIWRAAIKQDQSLLQQLGSATVEACVSAANQGVDSQIAGRTIQELSVAKGNTVIGEFAKRMRCARASQKDFIRLSGSLISPWRLRCARSPICRRAF